MNIPFFQLLIGLICLTSIQSFAIEIPKNLSATDRIRVTKMLGVSTSTKLLSNPYPLGGYQGLEVGISYEVVDIEDLSRLGDKTTSQNDFSYPRISVGKGLFHDVDLFLNFIPYDENNEVSEYGGMAKWCFYQGKFLPISLSLLGHMSVVNISDSFVNKTFGAEILAGINLNNFSLYIGGGQLTAQSVFMVGNTGDGIVAANDPGVDPQEKVAKENLSLPHTFLGIQTEFLGLFAAAQIDRYSDTVYSAKLGVRF